MIHQRRNYCRRMFKDIKSRLEEAMDVQSILICTEDYREAVKAREEKRPPVFRGR